MTPTELVDDVDLLGADAIADPHVFYGRLRENDPVHWNSNHRSWVLSRYEDVAAAFSDSRFSSDRIQPVFDEKLTPEEQARRAPIFAILQSWMVFNDPPDHTRLRNLVKMAFTPRAVQRLKPRVEAVVDDTLASLPSGTVDIVSDVAYPIPILVIAEMLGVPGSDRHLFRGWSDDVSKLVFGGVRDDASRSRVEASLLQLRDYLRELVTERQAASARDDLISGLVRAHTDDDELSIDEVVAICVMLLFAGHETTTNLIANSFLALQDEPEQRRAFAAGKVNAADAVEELNRFDGPSRMVVRRVGEDLEFSGRQFHAGDRLFLCQSAANRDPRQFENPDALDLTRTTNRHVAFGFGIHYCLGAPLARLEAQTAIPRILHHFEGADVTLDGLSWKPLIVVRALERLEVRRSEGSPIGKQG